MPFALPLGLLLPMPDSPSVHPETLAAHLARAPLPLDYALRCATDVAAVLRELHQHGAVHGAISLDTICLQPAGATLGPRQARPESLPARDVAAFGTVLYAMLTGHPFTAGEVPSRSKSAPRNSREGLRLAALGLAAKCMGAEETGRPDMRQVLTEVRLTRVQVNQYPAIEAVRAAPTDHQRPAPRPGPRLVDEP